MALPKFTTTPTPAYQQQPIIKRPNFSELYLRSFAASEAATYNSFDRIAKRIDKIADNKEKKRLQKIKDESDQNAKNQRKYSRNKDLDERIRRQASYLSTSGQGNALEVFTIEADTLSALYEMAEDDPTGEAWAEVAVQEKAIFDNIGFFRGAMQKIEALRKNAGNKDFNAIYSNFQPDAMFATFREEVVDQNFYDVKLDHDENGNIVVAWTNHLKEEDEEGYNQVLTAEDLSKINLESFGMEKLDFTDEDSSGGQIMDEINKKAYASKNPDLLKALYTPGKTTITNQRSIGTGSIEIATQDVQRRGENERKLILGFAANALNTRLTPYDKGMIWNDKIAVGAIETHTNRAVQEIIELSNGGFTNEDTDRLKAAVLRYGHVGKATDTERMNDPVLNAVHTHLDMKTVAWAANEFYDLKVGVDEKKLADPNIIIKTDFDDATIAEANRITFLNNLNDTLAVASDINTFKLKTGETSLVQQKLNELADLGYDAFKNTKNNAELVNGTPTIIADGFTYTDETQDYEIFSTILKSKGFSISDEEAKKLYRGYVFDIKYQGQAPDFLYKQNGLEKGYYENWLNTEKAKLEKSINATISKYDSYEVND